MKLNTYLDTKLDLQISPLIDVVFLLLIYFMVTASLIKKEADIGFQLPMGGGVEIDLPVEVTVQIQADGRVEVEGIIFEGRDRSLKSLVHQISGLRQLASSQSSEFYVNIAPHQNALHQRVIDVMDACAAAGVDKLGFSKQI